MKRTLTTVALVFAATAVVVAAAWAADPTREEYVATIDPICKKNVDANKKVLKGVGALVKAGKLKIATSRFTQVAATDEAANSTTASPGVVSARLSAGPASGRPCTSAGRPRQSNPGPVFRCLTRIECRQYARRRGRY